MSPWLHFDPTEKLTRADRLSLTAAGCAVFSGIVHLGMAWRHYQASPTAGLLFGLTGVWQLYAAFHEYPSHARWWNLSQIAFNAGLVAVYVVSRIVPVLHDAPEPVEWLGLLTKASEIILILCLVGLLRLAPQSANGEADSRGRSN